MKEFIIVNAESIFTIVTMFVTWFVGIICKKCPYIKNKLIPIQNILIMIISTGLYYYATGDLSLIIASSSPVATLLYDTVHCCRSDS